MNIKLINKIQIFSIILILASIAMICAGLVAVVFSITDISILKNSTADMSDAIATKVRLLAEGLVMIIHYSLVIRFLGTCLKQGVPFSHEGAKEIRTIGWETILLPLLVQLVSLIAHTGIENPTGVFEVEAFELLMGVILIQTGYVIDYGTELLEKQTKRGDALRYIEEHHPEAIDELIDDYYNPKKEN